MKNAICNQSLLFFVLVLSLGGLIATAQSARDSQPATAHKAPVATAKPGTYASLDPGERAFQSNCSRCHNAPEQLNPRITSTVVRHMRVRANLSAADEHAILRFFNP